MKPLKVIHFVIELVTTAVLLFSSSTTAMSVWLACVDEEYFAYLPYDSYLLGFCHADSEHLVRWGLIATVFSFLFMKDLWRLRTGSPLPPATAPGSGSFPIFGLLMTAVLIYVANICWTAHGWAGGGAASMSYYAWIYTPWNSYNLTTENTAIIAWVVTVVAFDSVLHVLSHFRVAFFEHKATATSQAA